MADNIKMEDLFDKDVDSTSETTEEQEETTGDVETATEVESEQDPLKTELEKVQQRVGRSEKEKAEYTLRKNAERVKELGGDPTDILGIKTESYDEDDTPLTVGMLKKLQQETTAKTAMQQADEIPNEVERELTKHHLQNTIRSTGNASEDIKLARALVNAVKNTEIIKEVSRKTPPKTHSNSSGVDGKQEETPIYTPEEQAFMKPPFNATPADIMNARKGISLKFKK